MEVKKEEFVTWKTCRTCGEPKPLEKSFGSTSKKRKNGTRKKIYDPDCHKCKYKKKNPNARPRRSAGEVESEESYQVRLKELLKHANRKLHPYL